MEKLKGRQVNITYQEGSETKQCEGRLLKINGTFIYLQIESDTFILNKNYILKMVVKG